MIPQAFINEWRATAPWATDAQIEQDLILSRAIADIFSEPLLAKSIAFRGVLPYTNYLFNHPRDIQKTLI